MGSEAAALRGQPQGHPDCRGDRRPCRPRVHRARRVVVRRCTRGHAQASSGVRPARDIGAVRAAGDPAAVSDCRTGHTIPGHGKIWAACGEDAFAVTECYRARRFGSRATMPSVDISGGLTFAPVDGATRMSWFWRVRPSGPLRLLGPLVARLGRRQERIWTGLKNHLEGSGRAGAPTE
jgi:hypothetical protein